MLQKRTLFLIIVTGLLVCQFIATGHVFLSNRSVREQTSIVGQAGYIAVPNAIVAMSLTDLPPAVAGGLFFTLSLGAGLTVFSFFIAWSWIVLFDRSRSILKVIILIQFLMLLSVNWHGINLFPSLYILFVPLAVFLVTISGSRSLAPPTNLRIHIGAHAIPILILSIFWGSQMNGRIFINVRDTLLLSNTFGIKMNSFYYDYTLNAAEAFRPIHQKLIKTCRILPSQNSTLAEKVLDQMVRFDYLPVQTRKPVDLELSLDENGTLHFSHHDTPVFSIPVSRFLREAESSLSRISSMCDKNQNFRFFTITSLVIGLPLLLYALLYLLMYGGLRLFIDERKAMVIVSSTGLMIGLLLLVPVYLIERGEPDAGSVGSYLSCDGAMKRLQALRRINDSKLEITQFNNYMATLTEKSVPERYWAVRALGGSHSKAAYDQLVVFLDSTDINIACMAYLALGMMKDTRAVHEIIRRIGVSQKWYVQWYAYKALRRLKWRQTRFP